jgi:hypothetical protein
MVRNVDTTLEGLGAWIRCRRFPFWMRRDRVTRYRRRTGSRSRWTVGPGDDDGRVRGAPGYPLEDAAEIEAPVDGGDRSRMRETGASRFRLRNHPQTI